MTANELEEELVKVRKKIDQDVPLMLGLLEDLTTMTKGERLGKHLDTLVSLYQRIGHKQEAQELMPKMLKLNPNAHETRIRVIKEKLAIPEQVL